MSVFKIELKMATTRIISCINKRQINRYMLIFIVILIQISVCQCYSQVRRSGSTAAVDELRNVVTQKLEISPMLKPSRLTIDSKSHASKSPVKKYDRSPLEHRTSDSIDLVKYNNDNGNSTILDEIADAIDLVEGDILPSPARDKKVNKLEKELLNYVDDTFSKDNYNIFDGVKIEPVTSMIGLNVNVTGNGSPRTFDLFSSDEEEKENDEFDTSVIKKFSKYARTHMMSINLPEAARFFGFKFPQGKSTFLTGFGLGFLAFGLKKLLLPLFLGAQIVKSVLIAMFLPSILGSIGKIVGKGLSQFSGSSINLQPQGQMDDVDYKDNMGYPSEQDGTYTYPNGDTIGTLPANTLYGGNNNGVNDELANVAMSRFGPGGAKVTYLPSISDNYYRNGQKKQEDFKVFRNIPASSLLLSNYDPFYSPLLSRLDSVFQRLGLGDRSERCRERLVCLMYASPAKYAPYSNLVSAQLSRELNELRKPTSDNPEILRFFKYMKAAKEGQEGVDCARSHPQCPGLTSDSGSAAMLTTYNDINKLVSARKI